MRHRHHREQPTIIQWLPVVRFAFMARARGAGRAQLPVQEVRHRGRYQESARFFRVSVRRLAFMEQAFVMLFGR